MKQTEHVNWLKKWMEEIKGVDQWNRSVNLIKTNKLNPIKKLNKLKLTY